jgi:hypothetical protein
VRSLGDDGRHWSLEPLLRRGKWCGWDTRSTGSSSSARARARGVTWLCECIGGTTRRRRRARRGGNGMRERGARRAAAFVAGAAPCLHVEVRAGVNTSVRRPASVSALTQGRDRWPNRWTHACSRAASGGATHYWAWGPPVSSGGGAGTECRGPAPAHAYGGVRRRTARRGARCRVMERESAAGVAMC